MKNYQMQLHHFLKSYFKSAQENNPLYSLRAFAKKLEMNSGSLSLLLKGKRSLSRKKALAILNKLSANSDSVDKVFHQLSDEENYVFDKDYGDFSTYDILSAEDLDFFMADDLSIKILALSETEGFKFDPAWISEKLKVDPKRVQAILNILSHKKYFDLETAKKKNNHYFQTTDSKTSLRIRQFHKKSLDEAKLVIDHLPTESRDITSCVFACDPEQFEKAQDLIRSFHQQLMALMSAGPKKEVYKLNIQLYPCSQIETQEDQ